MEINFIRYDYYEEYMFEADIIVGPDPREDWWDYNAASCVELVTDCLNENIFSLAGGPKAFLEYMDYSDTSLSGIYRSDRVAMGKEFRGEEICDNVNHREIQRYKKRTALVKEELKKIDLPKLREFVDIVFVEKAAFKSPRPTALERYAAYCLAYNDFDILQYSVTATPESGIDMPIESDDADGIDAGISELRGRYADEKERFGKICKFMVEKNAPFNVFPSYKFGSLAHALNFTLLEMIRNNCTVKKCENCNKYFVPLTRSDARYCENPAPQSPEKTCGDYSKYMNYLEKTRTDPATKLYRQIYNNMRNKANRYQGSDYGKRALSEFTQQAKRWKADIRAGRKTEDEYIAWLTSVKDINSVFGKE